MRRRIHSNPVELEDLFLDGFLHKKTNDDDFQNRRIEKPLKRGVFWLFLSLGLVALFFLLAVTFFFQVVKGQEYREMSLKNQFLQQRIKTERGVIFDRNGVQLAFNDIKFAAGVKVKDFLTENSPESQKSIIAELANILKESKEDIRNAIERAVQEKKDYVVFKEGLSHKELVILYSNMERFKGMVIFKKMIRSYLNEPSLSHILGYLTEISKEELKYLKNRYRMGDLIGREGVEKEYENILAEKRGIIQIEKDARGREISRRVKQEPRSGESLVLTLDVDLQRAVSRALQKVIESREADGGAVVVLDPNSGEVLSSVSLPSYNNNIFARGINKKELEALNSDPRHPQLNRVIAGMYPVGSTIKPLLALAALEEGIIYPSLKIFCPEKLCVENKYTHNLECFSDWKFHGWTDVKRAIAESVNPFFYIIGGGYQKPRFNQVDSRLPDSFKGLGVKKITEWLQKFGWGKKTEIDLPGEQPGRVPSPEWKEKYFSQKSVASRTWHLGDTYNLSIGQGYILATPLQVATAFQAIANFGTIYQPHLLKRVFSSLSKNEDSTSTQNWVVVQGIASKKNIEVVRQGMRQTVASPSGSAHFLNDVGVSVAAKTGTAQTPKKDVYYNWITLFAPYDNPKIVVVVLLENVRGLKLVAQKVAKDILRAYFFNESGETIAE